MSDNVPIIDKLLHADGSVTTLAGGAILPADQNRAEEYANRAAAVDKWLHADGSVTDSKGKLLLAADESRAEDYAARSPGVSGVMMGGSGFTIEESGIAMIQPYAGGSETLTVALAFGDGAASAFVPYIKESEIVPNNYTINDTATAVLS